MLKVIALYGHPVNPDVFEDYYAQTHMPLVNTIPGLLKVETNRFLPGPDGASPAYYRMAELYFAGAPELQAALGSPEGRATSADLANFATGGVTLLTGNVD